MIMSLTKRCIFLKVNLNVYTVVIKFYRNYVTNSLSFLKVKKFWKFLRGGGSSKTPLERKILGGGGGGCKSKSLPWWGYGYFLEPHNLLKNYFGMAQSGIKNIHLLCPKPIFFNVHMGSNEDTNSERIKLFALLLRKYTLLFPGHLLENSFLISLILQHTQ